MYGKLCFYPTKQPFDREIDTPIELLLKHFGELELQCCICILTEQSGELFQMQNVLIFFFCFYRLPPTRVIHNLKFRKKFVEILYGLGIDSKKGESRTLFDSFPPFATYAALGTKEIFSLVQHIKLWNIRKHLRQHQSRIAHANEKESMF